MVLIITGSAEPERNTLGRRLAEALGWEFVDAENLRLHGHPDARKYATLPTASDPPPRLATLAASINLWIYEWRDVVVSCPLLTETERRQLSKMSSLVKIVCLELSQESSSYVPARSFDAASSGFSTAWYATRDRLPDVLTVDSSRQVEEIIAEMTAVLIMRKSPVLTRN